MPLTSTPEELRAWIRLSLEPDLGPAQARMLLAAIGLPQDIYAMSAAALAKHIPFDLARQLHRPPADDILDKIDHTLQWLQEPGHHILTLADPDYPRSLLDTYDPPLLLFAHGNVSLLSNPCLGIVGARSATAGGLDNARAFARHLATQGWSIVSGLALGIDAAAHEGALHAGPEGGSTIAVLGTGIDIVYPARNRDLAHRIAQHGLLITELPLGTHALPYQFPKRNRLVAGLCQGILVVEAARQSGSLITARLAGELGREVFAIPGSIHSPLARGCHALIRQGAKLVESADDIHDELRQPSQGTLVPRGRRASPKTALPEKRNAHSRRIQSPAQATATPSLPDTPVGTTTAPASQPAGTGHPVATGGVHAGKATRHSGRPSDDTTNDRSGCDGDTANPAGSDGDVTAVLQALGYDPVHPDVLLQRTGMDVARLTAALLQLELAEIAYRQPDGCYQRL